jgi:hypothetical protein
MDPPGPVAGFGDGALLSEATPATLEAFLSVVNAPQGQSLMSAELRHLGGALTPGVSEGGVVSGLDGAFLLFTGGMAPTVDAGRRVAEVVDELLGALAPWRSASDYLNFSERRQDPRRFFGRDLDRLAAVAHGVDPCGLMHANHPVVGLVEETRS